MKTNKRQAGFSLMEVNMAIFVMAVGVLGIAALFPLGLRESTQSQADLKQSMFADYMLNQAVAAASRTDIKWSVWKAWVDGQQPPETGMMTLPLLPSFITEYLIEPKWNNAPIKDKQYKIVCCGVPGASDRIMGIMVLSTDLQDKQFPGNPVYYAEVMFQGDPTQ